MTDLYRISVPIEAIIYGAFVDSGTTGSGLRDGLELFNILRVREVKRTTTIENITTEDSIYYLDMEVSTDNYHEAVSYALRNAQLFVQLMSLQNKDFEVKLSGVKIENLSQLKGASGYVSWRSILVSLDEIKSIWEKIIELPDGNIKEVVELGLEWAYLGKNARTDFSSYLAYATAFELLVEGSRGNEVDTTVINGSINNPDKQDELKERMIKLLEEYISENEYIVRLVNYMYSAKIESNTKRWARIVNSIGVDIKSKEIDGLYHARSKISHEGKNGYSKSWSTFQLREIVVQILNALIEKKS